MDYFCRPIGNGHIIHWLGHNSDLTLGYSADDVFIETNCEPGKPQYARKDSSNCFRFNLSSYNYWMRMLFPRCLCSKAKPTSRANINKKAKMFYGRSARISIILFRFHEAETFTRPSHVTELISISQRRFLLAQSANSITGTVPLIKATFDTIIGQTWSRARYIIDR